MAWLRYNTPHTKSNIGCKQLPSALYNQAKDPKRLLLASTFVQGLTCGWMSVIENKFARSSSSRDRYVSNEPTSKRRQLNPEPKKDNKATLVQGPTIPNNDEEIVIKDVEIDKRSIGLQDE
ncbi:hypothetical protein FNV43_RR21587 [Rhamnella rubrinervis]|uniref:Uncharacterized protein n=1 Tax=Rhamnella rubrinervis TaxID=2594499 RepID=A0A8K0GMC3_9ROSA|nr:hypothetical protein FNV43_RR21587 [Rhamnella rubrinervis]